MVIILKLKIIYSYLSNKNNRRKIQPKNIMVFGSNYAVKEAVKNGLGVTFI